jgi:hypothetical protein
MRGEGFLIPTPFLKDDLAIIAETAKTVEVPVIPQ